MHRAYKRNMPIRAGGKALLLIDTQVDFTTGSLAVPGAERDAEGTAKLVRDGPWNEIYVTLDTHQRYHVAHPVFWHDREGNHPKPFQTITAADFRNGTWMPVDNTKSTLDWCSFYLQSLQELKKQLTIWPEHCLVGSTGGCVEPHILAALLEWEGKTGGTVVYVHKGANSFTEHYSAFKAEVPRPDDPTTDLNVDLIHDLLKHDNVTVCGQALSHCVGSSVADLADNWDQSRLKDIILMENLTSPVPGFEAAGESYVASFRKRGITITTYDFKSKRRSLPGAPSQLEGCTMC
mmetsp:Transcript_6924/g.22298  ORF Transcript_6924/g.22298 Transcript_6924/m.22298 type:complete len:292 (+) Transcript_6924:166-1041(+)